MGGNAVVRYATRIAIEESFSVPILNLTQLQLSHTNTWNVQFRRGIKVQVLLPALPQPTGSFPGYPTPSPSFRSGLSRLQPTLYQRFPFP